MSSLIFDTSPERAIVIMDTLAVLPGGTPYLFKAKALYLPHLQLIVAVTGHGPFLEDWHRTINVRLLVRGIENLDHHAPRVLRKAWARAQDEGEAASKTTTVYHFGVSEITGEIVTFAYRSANDFESERIPHGYGIKPPIAAPEGDPLQQIPEIMAKQRRRQAELPEDERVYIGGDAIAMQLTPEGCSQWRLFRFEDYDDAMAAALATNGLR